MPPEAQSCQIAQTERKWSSDKLRNGSNNKEMIILKVKQSGVFFLYEMVHLNYKRFSQVDEKLFTGRCSGGSRGGARGGALLLFRPN